MKVLFFDGTRGFSPHKIKSEPAGGIVTSLTLIPAFLSAMGIECYIKSGYDKDEFYNGVNYLSLKTPSPRTDIVVFNRNAFNGYMLKRMIDRKSKIIWWLHDIVDHRYLDDGSYRYIDNIVSLADYCSDTYSAFYNIPRDWFHKIPNGIDPSVWYPGKYEKRDPSLFVYASAPTKGYSAVQFAYHNIKRYNPHAKLVIYGNQSLHGLENTPMFMEWQKAMRGMGAEIKDPIPQKALADVFRKAWCLLMPNDYPEMCSNLILQARACGLPVVTSPIGGATEWIEDKKTGILTEWLPHDKFMWWADFAKKVMGLIVDRDFHQQISSATPNGIPTWENIANQWFDYLNYIYNGKSKNNHKFVSV